MQGKIYYAPEKAKNKPTFYLHSTFIQFTVTHLLERLLFFKSFQLVSSSNDLIFFLLCFLNLFLHWVVSALLRHFPKLSNLKKKKKHSQKFTDSLFLSFSFSTFQPSISSPDLQMHLHTFPNEFCNSDGPDPS